jgi:hypothetical protein
MLKYVCLFTSYKGSSYCLTVILKLCTAVSVFKRNMPFLIITLDFSSLLLRHYSYMSPGETLKQIYVPQVRKQVTCCQHKKSIVPLIHWEKCRAYEVVRLFYFRFSSAYELETLSFNKETRTGLSFLK